MNFYLINNSEAILNNKKVDHSSKIFWVSNEKEKEELSGAFKNLGKEKTANSIEKGYAYVFSAGITSKLRKNGKLEEKKGRTEPSGIRDAYGLKVYNETNKTMEVYDQFPLSIFNIMKIDNTLVGGNTGLPEVPEEEEIESSGGFWNWFGACCKPRR